MVHEAQPVDGRRQEQADLEGVKASVKADALVILGFLVDHEKDWRPEIKTIDRRVIRVRLEIDDD